MARFVLRWVLPSGAGAIAAVVLSAGTAHATVDSLTYTGPTNPTTGQSLRWDVTGTAGDSLSCSLLLGNR